ncbi:MAG: transposase [Chromatiaceae bacterium]|nr:transposase [Chromatiaceae bacterium]
MTSETSETPRQRRHRYDAAFKRSIVEQTVAPGASVARIAREHFFCASRP